MPASTRLMTRWFGCSRSSVLRSGRRRSRGLAFERLERRDVFAGAGAAIPYFQGFDSAAAVDANWTLQPDAAGRVQFATDGTRGVMRMDNPGGASTNRAVLSVNLTGKSGVKVVYEHHSPGNEVYANNGIFISDDQGVTWHQAETLGVDNSWTRHEVNLDAAVAAAGMSYGPDFRIAIRQQDNWTWFQDGRQFDNFRVTTDGVAPSVRATTPANSVTQSAGLDRIAFTFSEAIDPGTFTLSDVALTGPNGDLTSAISGIQGSGSTFTVLFTKQTALGEYRLTLGPDIRDFGANPLDQNGNGLVAEAGVDGYTASVSIVRPASLPYSEDFETGRPGSPWSYYSSGNGRVTIDGGRLLMDTASGFALNEAILHLNLVGASNVTLAFDHDRYADEVQTDGLSVGGTFTELHRNADLVALSDDGGASWYVLDMLDQSDRLSFDLSSVAATAGLNFTSDFLVKFQQYDNSPYAGDGRLFDNVSVRGAAASPGRLTLARNKDWVYEIAGSSAATGTVTRQGGDLNSPLTVRLTSSDPSELRVPGTVVIPAGATSATFAISAVYDRTLDGNQTTTITAAADDVAAVSTTMSVVEVTNWRNPLNPSDVDYNGLLAAADVLAVINHINRDGTGMLPNPPVQPDVFVDISGDQRTTAYDAILAINAINARGGGASEDGGGFSGEAEGEEPANFIAPVESTDAEQADDDSELTPPASLFGPQLGSAAFVNRADSATVPVGPQPAESEANDDELSLDAAIDLLAADVCFARTAN